MARWRSRTMKIDQHFSLILLSLGLQARFIREYRFDEKRKWRFDFADPVSRIAIEIEGGAWTYGRHNRSEGFIQDCEKYNAAAVHGWRVLRYATIEQMRQFEADLTSLEMLPGRTR